MRASHGILSLSPRVNTQICRRRLQYVPHEDLTPSTNTMQGRQQHTAQEAEKEQRPQWSSNRARALGQSPQGPGAQHLELTQHQALKTAGINTDTERNKAGSPVVLFQTEAGCKATKPAAALMGQDSSTVFTRNIYTENNT